MERKPVHLIMVTAANNNKYYDMVPKGDVIEIKYGRVDSTCTTITKPIGDWDKIYKSKIKKGYVDKSELVADLVQEVKKKDLEYKPIPNKVVAKLVERLQDFAKKTIASNYNVKANQVTQKMVDEAQAKIIEMSAATNIDDFNNLYLQLMEIIPRKMDVSRGVSSYLLKDFSKMQEKIDKEQSLLDTMRGQVVIAQLPNATDEDEEYQNNCTILEALGIEIEETTDEDVALIKKELGDKADRYYDSWKIRNIAVEERFNKWTKEHNMKKKDIKYLLHGSRNENIFGIMSLGIKIFKPSGEGKVRINGRMLGHGAYNATAAEKAMNYCSLQGWCRDSSNLGFLYLTEVAMGKSFDIYAFDSKYYDFDYDKLKATAPDCESLFAHKGMDTGWNGGWKLQNDEIVVYNEEQINLKYLIEVR